MGRFKRWGKHWMFDLATHTHKYGTGSRLCVEGLKAVHIARNQHTQGVENFDSKYRTIHNQSFFFLNVLFRDARAGSRPGMQDTLCFI